MASLANVEHRNQEATVYVGNLDAVCTEKILLELFAQVGRVKSVYMPTDKITNTHNGYGFIEFLDTRDADYAIQILNMMKFYNRPLKVNKSSVNNSKTEMWSRDVGANLFVGNLDPIDVDEHLLYDTFGAFGTLIKQPKIMREEDTGESKGFGFVSYDSFEASDTALECMSGQYLGNRQIIVQYAFKKETSIGGNNPGSANTSSSTNHSHERHGSRAERMLAAQRKSQQDQLQQSSSLNVSTISGVDNANSISSSAVNRMMPPPPPPPAMRGGMGAGTGTGAARGFGDSIPGHYGPPSGGGGYYQPQHSGMMPPPPPPPMMGMNMGGAGMSMYMPPPPPPPPPPMMQPGRGMAGGMPPPPPPPPPPIGNSGMPAPLPPPPPPPPPITMQ